jgi:hypothetical protein
VVGKDHCSLCVQYPRGNTKFGILGFYLIHHRSKDPNFISHLISSILPHERTELWGTSSKPNHYLSSLHRGEELRSMHLIKMRLRPLRKSILRARSNSMQATIRGPPLGVWLKPHLKSCIHGAYVRARIIGITQLNLFLVLCLAWGSQLHQDFHALAWATEDKTAGCVVPCSLARLTFAHHIRISTRTGISTFER